MKSSLPETVNRTSKHWRTKLNFQKLKAAFVHEVAVERFNSPDLTWMMVSEIELLFAENRQIFALTHSTIFAAIKQITTMGPVLEVLVFKCLGDIGIAIQCSPKETSCIVSC